MTHWRASTSRGSDEYERGAIAFGVLVAAPLLLIAFVLLVIGMT